MHNYGVVYFNFIFFTVMLTPHIFGGSMHTVRKSTKTSVIASKEIRLVVNAEKSKYMVIFRDQNAGQSGNIQIGNKSFESVEQFK
jgi:hypothetical protein